MFSAAERQPDTASSVGGDLELWGGYECTVNRVGDRWYDQTRFSGHQDRLDDLRLFADLGLKSLRYPALWERISPAHPDLRDFTWTDERLGELRRLKVNPIVTLCHHGSGPRYTSLLEDSFATGLARHARAVAERYPWIGDWTPVNEPLTTARFSALNGYWYPHLRDETSCWIVLLNEIDATRFAMREIRRVNPQARLIQTDDLGFCHATTPLATEAEFQNERRWMGWDLLCGKVTQSHPLWDRLVGQGLEDRLRRISDDPCPPDVIGVNHYLSSERLLDHDLESHADRAIADRDVARTPDGLAHVDVDAVRRRPDELVGVRGVLQQAWERYGLPLAVTECHLGSTREEQGRWFLEVWSAAAELRASGVDVRAVTAWSLLGAYDWNRMVTKFVGHYEPGVFDVRSGRPRPTAVAKLLRALATGSAPTGVGLSRPGGWRRRSPAGCREAPRDEPPLLLLGPGGPLSRLAVAACRRRGLPFVRRGRACADEVAALSPWAIVSVDDWAAVCDRSPNPTTFGRDLAPPIDVAKLAADFAIPCAAFSALDGFDEIDAQLISAGGGRLLLARTDAVFTPWNRRQRPNAVLDAMDAGLILRADPGQPWEGVYGPDLIDVVLDLLMDGVTGPLALAPPDGWSDWDFLEQLAQVAEYEDRLQKDVRAVAPIASRRDGSGLLSPGATMLERFVRESRAARSATTQPASVVPDLRRKSLRTRSLVPH